jgi:hypothetical protein
MGDWAAALIVCVSEGGRLLTPLLRLEGRHSFSAGTVRIELVDDRGEVRRVARRPLVARLLGREIRMPCVTAPNGGSLDELARCAWDIVVESEGRELVRWRRYVAGRPSVNAEGELELAGPGDPRRAKEEAEGRGPEALWDPRDSERLLAVLVDEGELTERDRDAVLAAHNATGITVERVLVEHGLADEHELFELYAELTGTEFVDLSECSIDPCAVALIPEEISLRHGLIAVDIRDDELLTVAMSDPQSQPAVREVEATCWRQIYIVVATRDDVMSALESTLLRSLP